MAAELGIKPNRLYAWRASLAPAVAKAGGGPFPASPEEVAHLRQQRDILKKTLGILSEPPNSAINGLKS